MRAFCHQVYSNTLILIINPLIYNLAIVRQSMPWLHWDPGKINEQLVPSVRSPNQQELKKKKKEQKTNQETKQRLILLPSERLLYNE
jgi:hypothetical protein